MYNAYFIQHSFYLHPPPPFVLSHCPSYYYSVAFQGRCAQVLQIYGNRKLTDPHFQEKIWPISVHPSDYIQFVLSFFDLFRYSLISIHLVNKNSTRTAVGVILNTIWWNAPMLYHLWCQTNAALMRTSTNNPLFSSNCTTWLIHVHPTCSDENILAVLHIIPLDLQFRHVQRHVR